jgi:hypothetical protein
MGCSTENHREEACGGHNSSNSENNANWPRQAELRARRDAPEGPGTEIGRQCYRESRKAAFPVASIRSFRERHVRNQEVHNKTSHPQESRIHPGLDFRACCHAPILPREGDRPRKSLDSECTATRRPAVLTVTDEGR